MLLAALAAGAVAATPFAGLEWRPLSRQDLTWVQESRTSGLAVGEFDGTARPNLQAFGGAWLTPGFALQGSLGVARMQNTTDLNEVVRQRHWGVIRLAIELRWALARPQPRRARPYLLTGIHGDIPSVRDVSNGYTRKEQKAADENVLLEKARIAGVGARAGLGATYPVTEGIHVGGQYMLQWHRAVFQADDLSAVTQWLSAEASLVIAFEWPRAKAPDDSPSDGD